jgi:hypothetical protein
MLWDDIKYRITIEEKAGTYLELFEFERKGKDKKDMGIMVCL